MPRTKPPFTIGIEEEYHLVDLESREIATSPPEALFKESIKQLGDHVNHEFMASQIEIGTPVCSNLAEAREHLSTQRQVIIDVSAKYGLAPIAAATHPISRWRDMQQTNDARYNDIAEDLQAVVRRLLISGMHVHVGLGEDDDIRMDLMQQASYFLPHLLALSASSPYWQGQDTGLASYRLSIFTELPRTGLPQPFETYQDYQRHVDILIKTGILEDATKIWWDMRPSDRYPTLEMRICDVCTYIDDALAIAALYMCILRMLYRLKSNNQRWRQYSNMLIEENRWRAQRYGTEGPLIDFGKGALVPFDDLLTELMELLEEDISEAGCEKEIAHIRTILKRGTSTQLQRKAYADAISDGQDHGAALKAVVDYLVSATRPNS
jgi:glutamate---cysteine ligase / carboxylate-amine ligase